MLAMNQYPHRVRDEDGSILGSLEQSFGAEHEPHSPPCSLRATKRTPGEANANRNVLRGRPPSYDISSYSAALDDGCVGRTTDAPSPQGRWSLPAAAKG